MYHEEVPDLARTLASFRRAGTILSESCCKDPNPRRKIYFRLAQIEIKLTYQVSELDKKEGHMETAETYIKEAMLAANQTGIVRHIVQTRFERACMKGRRLELKKKRDLDRGQGGREVYEICQEITSEGQDICQEITSEGQKLQELDNDIWTENSEHARYWLERLKELIKQLDKPK